MTDETKVDEPAAESKDDDEDDDSVLDDLIESITEVPHWLFRKVFGKD